MKEFKSAYGEYSLDFVDCPFCEEQLLPENEYENVLCVCGAVGKPPKHCGKCESSWEFEKEVPE